MEQEGILNQLRAVLVPGFLVVVMVGAFLFAASAGVVLLGVLLSYLSNMALQGTTIGLFHYVHIFVVLAISCSAAIGIPILLLARSIQRTTESFSLLQFEDEIEEDDEYDDDEGELADEDEELNEFLKKLHKTRNIGPFIPSPKTMEDLCPCGSGLKYKECCGRFWN